MSARMEGLGELRTAFGAVKEDMRLRTSRLMVASGGGVIRKESRSLAQRQGLKMTGALIKNIVIKRERTPDGLTQYNLGVRHGRHMGRNAARQLVVAKNGRVISAVVDDPFYWWFLEKGRNVYHGDGKRRRGVKSRVEATPYIAPALDNKRAEAVEAMATRLAAAIRKANGQ
ncbi:HK97 gp10 family phage protein [Pseudoduganella lurida]|uniref:HK97 gp10 family phage protein n=2 Tax=Pseudoduganella lurida TaxID=1036180 RepID=A0A562R7X6_9BURK|nr:HK97 gp10 family phage protein [Pseudoduganella lurida]